MATTSFIVALAQRGHSGGPTLRAVCCSGMTHGPSTRLLCLPSYTQRGQGWLVAGYRTLWCSSDGASGAGHRSVNATDRRQDIVSAGALAVVKLLRGSASVDGGCCSRPTHHLSGAIGVWLLCLVVIYVAIRSV